MYSWCAGKLIIQEQYSDREQEITSVFWQLETDTVVFSQLSRHVFSRVCLFAEEVLTGGQSEGHQVREEITGEVSFALMKRGCDLATNLLR